MTTVASTSATIAFLTREHESIVGDATADLVRARTLHYDDAGVVEIRRRLDSLLDSVVESLTLLDLGPMLTHARAIATARFESGYDLVEVQTAFNALEVAVWTHLLAEAEPAELAQALGLVTTLLGAGKDALAREYVSLATDARAPSLDVRALFAGAAGV